MRQNWDEEKPIVSRIAAVADWLQGTDKREQGRKIHGIQSATVIKAEIPEDDGRAQGFSIARGSKIKPATMEHHMKSQRILVTNDDGIDSPGLRAAVEAVMDLGKVTVVAPSNQQTAMGRSLTGNIEAKLIPVDYRINGVEVNAYHCECSPAMAVKHCLPILYADKKPDLLISGINYGENLGLNITISGTMGAALEASCSDIPAIAVSKQTEIDSHYEHTNQDWKASTHFLNCFATVLLSKTMPLDVDVLNINVPQGATPSTPWKITKLARINYFASLLENPSVHSRIGDTKIINTCDKKTLDPETDVAVFLINKWVSVTPLSLDFTSRVNFTSLQDVFSSR